MDFRKIKIIPVASPENYINNLDILQYCRNLKKKEQKIFKNFIL